MYEQLLYTTDVKALKSKFLSVGGSEISVIPKDELDGSVLYAKNCTVATVNLKEFVLF